MQFFGQGVRGPSTYLSSACHVVHVHVSMRPMSVGGAHPHRCEREKTLALKQVHEIRVEKEKAEYLCQESEKTCTKLAHE